MKARQLMKAAVRKRKTKLIWKQSVTVALLLIVVVLLPGCWDYKSISTRASVIGIGIDPVSKSNQKIRVTIQFPLLSQSSGPQFSSGNGAASHYENDSADGYSIEEVLRQLQLKMDRQIDTGQLRAIIVSDKLSGKLMDSVIGQLIRLPDINRLAYLFTTPDSATDILKSTPSGTAPMDFLDKVFTVNQHGYTVRRELWEYWRDTTQVGVFPVLPVVTPNTSKIKNSKSLQLTGLEIYWKNKPAATLDKRETLCVNLLTGEVKDMALEVPISDGVIALTDIRAHSRRRCLGRGNSLRLVDEVLVTATLAKLDRPSPRPIPPTNLNWMEKHTEAYLQEQLTKAVQDLQRHQTDVIGFGRIYLQYHPEDEELLKENWPAMFAHASVDIRVKVTINSKGTLI